MNHISHLTHAYRQAPWRVQRQWAGAFMLGVIALAMTCGLYLDVTSQAAIVGREIQYLQTATTEVQHENANLQSRLASLLSADSMEARALALGYRPAEAGELHYLVVPGFSRPSGVSLVPPGSALLPASLPSEYTQSLLEWISQYLNSPASGIAGGFLP